jgi:gliding motility-associated-like protein
MRALFCLIGVLYCLSATAQVISRAEYFFDSDPGKGNGNSLSLTQGATINQQHTISLGSLTSGAHTFNYRIVDSNGHWSQFVSRTFFIITPVTFINATGVRHVEYFFDTDPGPGNATPLSITESATQSNSFVLDISSLTPGFHQLSMRYRDNLARWSPFVNRTFYIVPLVIATTTTVVRKAEYFIDTDPGPGHGVALPISAADTQNNTFTIDISSVTAGFHQIGIRYQDDRGHWSLFVNRSFYKIPTNTFISASTIKKAEYFFDTDPGPGNGISLPITASFTQANSFNIDISPLSPGFHQLAIRYQDALNRWSTFSHRNFYILPGNIVSANLQTVEYFIDNDPGYGLGTNLAISPAPQINQLFTIDLTSVAPGSHKIFMRTKDSRGYWSYKMSGDFTILNCTPPAPPTAPAISRCGTGTVALSASGALTGQVYRWYADGSTSAVLFSGTTFTTPVLSTTTSYFVSVYDPATLCESNRTTATATIVNLSKPVLNLSGALSVCAGNTVTLIAPAGYAGYTWSNSLTTQQVTLTTSGNYSVIVSDGTCSSPPSDVFVFTVNPNPIKPVVSVTGGGSLCGGGSVTLTAPPGFLSYNWTTGQSTQSINVNTPGNFAVTVTDVNNCQSVPSDFSTVTSNSPAKPMIAVTGNTTMCDGATVTLDSPAGFSSYAWSNGATTQQIVVNTSGNFSVVVSNGSCSSPASDPVTTIAVLTPSKPAVQVSGGTAICLSAFTVLSAPAGYSNYLWSDGETTRQIVVSTAGNFSVQVGQAPSCMSVVSDPVATTLTGAPCGGGSSLPQPPVATSGSRCGQGTVVLAASGATTGQVYRWYDVPVTGTLLATGSTFTTPLLSSTTNYYVSIYDSGSGGESNTVMVTANVSILVKPSLGVSTPITICAGGSTLLSAPTGFNQYLWSNGAVTQQIQVITAGNYSVSTGDGSCFSPPSDPVTIIVAPNPVKPVVVASGSTTFCGNGSVVLTAPPGFQYRWTTGETTQAITVFQTNVISVAVINAAGCTSVVSDPVVVTRLSPPCTPNAPPVITQKEISCQIEGIAVADLTKIISDPDNNIDYSSIRLLSGFTGRNVPAAIDANYTLTVNYKGMPFTGIDHVTIEACDLQGLCIQKILEIDIVGEVVVFNGITPDGDGRNDFFYIQYVDVVPEAKHNTVTIFDTWGDKVFDIADYNNTDRVFTGLNSGGHELPSGNYFYRIDLSSGKPLTGYLTLKR